ncbi:MAG: DUF4384 domain-containing protein [Candidatus Eisenbacteria bacterium]|nr:DUF4384 domain-containing protein [Candidatus Eisenbacteria bacterium]
MNRLSPSRLGWIISILASIGLGIGAPPIALGGNLDVDLRIGVRTQLLVPVPIRGIDLELWSDPEAGTVVAPGDRANLYFRTDSDAYVTVMAVDTEGRVRRLFPRWGGDGWVEGGRTMRLPERHAGYDLRFAGPPGVEYVYAVATLEPVNHRYPEWMVDGRVWTPDPWCEDTDLWAIGWVVGDPIYQLRAFCQELVPCPDQPESYASAWISFNVGRRVSYPRSVCRDCHGFAPIDPYGRPCPAVSIVIDGNSCSGAVDFRIVFVPRWRYEVSRTWCSSHDRWRGHAPDGRWRWSSCDGPRTLRRHFAPDGRQVWGERHRSEQTGREKDRDRHDREVRGEVRERIRERDDDREGDHRGREIRRRDREERRDRVEREEKAERERRSDRNPDGSPRLKEPERNRRSR